MLKRNLLVAFLACTAAAFGQIKFNLDHLASRAKESVDITLDASTLGLAGSFLSKDDPKEAKVKGLAKALQGVYIRSFEFEKEGEYSASDVESIRTQLRAPEWTRIIGVRSKGDAENSEIYVRKVDGKNAGIAILAAEPKELTVVQILGPIDLDQLGELGGNFGIPKVKTKPKPEKGSKE